MLFLVATENIYIFSLNGGDDLERPLHVLPVIPREKKRVCNSSEIGWSSRTFYSSFPSYEFNGHVTSTYNRKEGSYRIITGISEKTNEVPNHFIAFYKVAKETFEPNN